MDFRISSKLLHICSLSAPSPLSSGLLTVWVSTQASQAQHLLLPLPSAGSGRGSPLPAPALSLTEAVTVRRQHCLCLGPGLSFLCLSSSAYPVTGSWWSVNICQKKAVWNELSEAREPAPRAHIPAGLVLEAPGHWSRASPSPMLGNVERRAA